MSDAISQPDGGEDISLTRRDQLEPGAHRPVERISDTAEPRPRSPRTTTDARSAMPPGTPGPRSHPVRRQVPSRRREAGSQPGVDPDQDPATLHSHRYTVRLATAQLDHEREIARVVRAMGRKKWALESRDAIPGATDQEIVTILTFVQTTATERAPNAPVPSSIVKSGASVPRRFR